MNTYTNRPAAPAQTGLSGDAKVIFSDHAKRQAAAKGFSVTQIVSALKSPEKVTLVMSRPEFIERGQRRYCGAGVAVVVEPRRDGVVEIKTVYLDGVRTALRADQMNDEYALTSARATRERRGGLVYSC